MMSEVCPHVECDTPDFSACPNISIDYSIMEKADNVYVQLCDSGGQIWEPGRLYMMLPQKTQTRM